jgi:hypothetical protein
MSMNLSFRNDVRSIETDTDLNMANSNASAFISVLGFTPDPEDGGLYSVPIAEFEQALRLWLSSEIASLVDTGTPTTVEQGGKGATMVFCGRSIGYFTPRIQLALQMTQEATSKGATFVSIV